MSHQNARPFSRQNSRICSFRCPSGEPPDPPFMALPGWGLVPRHGRAAHGVPRGAPLGGVRGGAPSPDGPGSTATTPRRRLGGPRRPPTRSPGSSPRVGAGRGEETLHIVLTQGYAPRQACNTRRGRRSRSGLRLKGLCAQAGLQQRDSQTLGAQGLAEASALTKHLCEKSPLSQAPNRAQSGYS